MTGQLSNYKEAEPLHRQSDHGAGAACPNESPTQGHGSPGEQFERLLACESPDEGGASVRFPSPRADGLSHRVVKSRVARDADVGEGGCGEGGDGGAVGSDSIGVSSRAQSRSIRPRRRPRPPAALVPEPGAGAEDNESAGGDGLGRILTGKSVAETSRVGCSSCAFRVTVHQGEVRERLSVDAGVSRQHRGTATS